MTQLEGVAGDLEKLLEEARTNDGKQPKSTIDQREE